MKMIRLNCEFKSHATIYYLIEVQKVTFTQTFPETAELVRISGFSHLESCSFLG